MLNINRASGTLRRINIQYFHQGCRSSRDDRQRALIHCVLMAIEEEHTRVDKYTKHISL